MSATTASLESSPPDDVERPKPRQSHVITVWVGANTGTCWYHVTWEPRPPWANMTTPLGRSGVVTSK